MFKTILVGSDASEQALQAAHSAAALARKFQAKVVLLNVFDDNNMALIHEDKTPYINRVQQEVEARTGTVFTSACPPDELDSDSYLWRVRAAAMAGVKSAADKAGVPYAFEQIVGKAAEVIVRSAQTYGSELIVMGGRGAGRLRALLIGSESKQVAQHAPCSVLFVP